MSNELHHMSAAALLELMSSGRSGSEEICTAFLDRIARFRGCGAYLHVDPEQVLADARQADRLRRDGNAGPLLGLPLALKDIFTTRGIPTTAGSRVLEGFVPPYDATVVARLRAAGAIVLGKCNMDEFAMGSTNENSGFFPCGNPWSRHHVPGGSSGGSACAVAGGLAPAALGTDTGGSIRQPASLCGIVGFKPAYGTLSRFGLIAFSSSLDQAGPMTRTVEDSILLSSVMAGRDPADSTTVDSAISGPARCRELAAGRKLRLGVPAEWFGEGIRPDVRARVDEALGLMIRESGAELVPLSLPHVNCCVSVYCVVAMAEASSNLARYDLLRYGKRPSPVAEYDLNEWYCQMRGRLFGAEVKRRIMIGSHVLSSGYYDAYYRTAQKVRRLIAQDFQAAFEVCDLVVGPVSPRAGIRFGDCLADPLTMYLNDILTISVNLVGAAGISVPAGFGDGGLPVGLQLISPRKTQELLLGASLLFEQARGPLPDPSDAELAALGFGGER